MVSGPQPAPQDVQATFCATLVDEWIGLGVRHAVIAPGSRSTPMALAITDRAELRVHVIHDERVAAFVALGLGLDGVPALLLCTSGTAAANFLPAVVEANLSEVPIVVLTADRPDELRDVGAPQTIDQLHLYGRHARWFDDAPVAEWSDRNTWRGLASASWSRAATGPVQLNLPFREPLVGAPVDLPERIDTCAASPPARRRDTPPPVLRAQRGVILAGGRSGVRPEQIERLHTATGWPIIADPTSGVRHLDGVVVASDALLRSPAFVEHHAVDVIVRIGRPASSKVLAQWSAAGGVPVVQVGGPGVIDPDRNVVAVCDIDDVIESVGTQHRSASWLRSWVDADRIADEAIAVFLEDRTDLCDPAVARIVAEHLADGAVVTVASSMPIRDLEWFGGRSARAHANRGANGIDGTIATALGRGLSGATSVLLVGDLAFVHDSNALVGLMARGVDLRIVVTDNDGGGIFSFLPQATALDHERFELLFGTPLGTDICALAAAHGVPATTVTTAAELAAQLRLPGPWVVRVPSDRTANVEIHRAINDAVIRAIG
jgi:2-succinyl-5-enolpyruvyl-6-hydroxy-3-cyclohexene-1-carboxylate synthase